ncbi:hypothetical protein TRFO_32038 [Tritrichomonas foetus]|uniref:Uncharacterized protein n=1 Tax=Tritrichomonas foetus TaxID=1144522 RepID=A0A1J4JRZ8_9EUKA|nr:hypothetical protein TRFO_32038 [Tritrichomonas foetus]|eukprot:OHT01208.1 hypothetical protein TRFO_32038 [Tritrichomonas foetus]
MSFYISRGFASLAYDDTIARTTYLEQLPMIAECLTFQHFIEEYETVLKSIAQYATLVKKINEVIPLIFEHLDKKQKYELLYLTGEKICISSEEKPKKSFLDLAEKLLQEMNDIPVEFETMLKPQLLPKMNNEYNFQGKFALWRLARLTVICSDYSHFEDLIFNMFAGNDIMISIASEVLNVMHPNLAKKYLIKALMSPTDSARISGIDAIEKYEISVHNDFIDAAFKSEKSPKVLIRIAQLPPKFLTKDIMEMLIQNDSTSSIASKTALSSPYFAELLPILKTKGGVGCEINNVDFSILQQCSPIPYDFLSLLLKESKEIIHENTIDSLLKLDTFQVTFRIIFPRMNENGNWRSRYNAILIATRILQRISSPGNSDGEIKISLDQANIMNFAGFMVSMGLDLVYAVREAAFKSIQFFPESSAVSIIDSMISIVTQSDEFQLLILREFLNTAHKSIVKYGDHVKLEKACTAVGIDFKTYLKCD